MIVGVVALTLICLLFTIGCVSMILSIVYEGKSNPQYVPTHPTQRGNKPSKNQIELATDIAIDYFSDEVEL